MLIPASSVGMTNPSFGSLWVHAKFAETHGKVFWSVFPPGKRRTTVDAFPHNKIKIAYFYDVLSRRVRFKARVHEILGGSQKGKLRKYSKYIPKFRRAYAKSRGHREEYWILVSDVSELVNPVRLGRLSRSRDGRPLRQARLYAIIEDPKLPGIES